MHHMKKKNMLFYQQMHWVLARKIFISKEEVITEREDCFAVKNKSYYKKGREILKKRLTNRIVDVLSGILPETPIHVVIFWNKPWQFIYANALSTKEHNFIVKTLHILFIINLSCNITLTR